MSAHVDVPQIEASFYAELGRRIHEERKARRLTSLYVSAELGVHRNTLARWEHGDQAIPILFLIRVAAVLECPPSFLLPDLSYTWPLEVRATPVYEKKGLQSERDPWIHSAGERLRKRSSKRI